MNRVIDKDTLAVWANMIQEGINCVNIAQTLDRDRAAMYFQRADEHLIKLRSEILQAKHCHKGG